MAKTSEDLGVVRSSLFVWSQRGFATIVLLVLAYRGLQVVSSKWTVSTIFWTCLFPIEDGSGVDSIYLDFEPLLVDTKGEVMVAGL